MRSILLSFERRAGRAASVALLGTAMIAACDNERPTAPVAAQPTTPSAALFTFGGALTWKTANTPNQSLIGGAKFEVVGGPLKSKWIVQDNGPGDSDPVAGQFKLVGVSTGQYQACEIAPPSGYALPWLNCLSGSATNGVTTYIGMLLHYHLPYVSDGYVDYGKNFIGGGTYTVKDSVGATIMTIVDNGALDSDKADGKFGFVLPSGGTFSICETTPPPGYVFPSGQANLCVTQSFPLNTGTGIGPHTVVPPYSVAWGVITGFFQPNNTPGWIGPSEFRVTKDDGSVVVSAIDNAANDMHLLLGAYNVKLPGAGTYQVCEVTPVPNHWLANPACHTVVVTFGQVAWADYFINNEKQVYKP